MDLFLDNFKIIQWVIWIFFALIIWALAVTFVKRKEHSASNEKHKTDRDELAGRVAKIEDTYSKKNDLIVLATKVNTIETQLKQVPEPKTIHCLEKEVGELQGSITGLKEQLTIFTNQVSMLIENELRGSK
jgi:hypothetical protein